MQRKYMTLKAAMIAAMSLGALAPVCAALAAGTPDGLGGATATIDKLAEAMRGNDAAAIGTILAHDDDTVSFGTDKAERWVGYAAMMVSLKAQLAGFHTTKIDVKDQVVHLMPSGDAPISRRSGTGASARRVRTWS